MFLMRSVLLLAMMAAAGVAEAGSGARVVHRLRRRAVQQSAVKTKAAGLNEVITVLLKMMEEFRDMEKEDKDNWEDWQAQADENQADKNECIRDQEGIIMQSTGLESAKKVVVAKLITAVDDLKDEMKDTRKSLRELTELRNEEHEQHQAALADMTKTIESVNKAVEILEGHYAVSGAALTEIKNRVQYAMSLAGTDSRPTKALTNLMQASGPDWLGVDGSKYNSYEKQGGAGGIISTLNDLRAALDQNKQDLIQNENANLRQYEDTKGAKENEFKRMAGEVEDKTNLRMKAESAITSAQASVSGATQNLADARAYLAKLKVDIASFTAEFQERTRMRDDEIAATQAALDALQAVTADAKEGVGFIQTHRASLLQRSPGCPRCHAEAQKLGALSSKLHSAVLAQVAGEMRQRAHGGYDGGNFGPVTELLRALIERLENEQSGETSHHEWCETEKAESVSAKEERERNIKSLQSEVERLTVSVEQLKGEVTFMTDELSRVEKESKDATSTRGAAHDIFAKSKADHDEVITALDRAIGALEGKYGLLQIGSKAVKKPRSFLQASSQTLSDATRASPFEGYSDSSGAAGSALMMLQDLLGRYSEARALLVSDEAHAADIYKELVATNKQFIADTRTTKDAKRAERRGKIEELKNDKEEMKSAFIELQELANYLQELRPKCDDIRSTYAERRRRREAEIAALQECLDVLADPSAMSL